MFYCYKITNQVNNKLYIGITKNFEQRRRQHVNVSTSTTDPQYNHRLYASIRKHGVNSFEFKIIKTMNTWNEIAEHEIYLIAKLDTMNEKIGYNLSKGGEGAYGAVRSEETKAKLRAITKKQMTPEARAHLSGIHISNNMMPVIYDWFNSNGNDPKTRILCSRVIRNFVEYATSRSVQSGMFVIAK